MSAALVLWHKHMIKLRVNPEEAVGMLIQPVLWVVLFGIGMKSLIGQGIPGGENDYLVYILPGIIALTALGGAIGGGTVWLNERLRGIVKEYLVAPIPRLSILVGNALSITTKSLFQAMVIFVVGVLMGANVDLNPAGWVGGLALVGLYGVGFGGIALAVATKTNNPSAYHMLIFLLNLPLLFVSNALYPMSYMPTWMELLSRANPTSYVADGVCAMVFEEGAALAGGETMALWLCFVVVVAFAGLGTLLAYVVFRRSIK